ncbi:MAL protein, partial [Polypterus senegalus]
MIPLEESPVHLRPTLGARKLWSKVQGKQQTDTDRKKNITVSLFIFSEQRDPCSLSAMSVTVTSKKPPILRGIFGGLVWILVASTKVFYANPQGWVMFVSVFCFVFTFIWLFLFLLGANQSSFWPGLDVLYHGTAALFYLSASVAQAYATILINPATNSTTNPYTGPGFKEYQEDIAAVVSGSQFGGSEDLRILLVYGAPPGEWTLNHWGSFGVFRFVFMEGARPGCKEDPGQFM